MCPVCVANAVRLAAALLLARLASAGKRGARPKNLKAARRRTTTK